MKPRRKSKSTGDQKPAKGAVRKPRAQSTRQSPVSKLKLSLLSETPKASLADRRWLVSQLRILASLAGVTTGDVRLRIVEDPAMAGAHLQYTGISGTTDVLTFDLRDNLEEPLDADIMICVDEAARQALARHHPTRMELLLYSLHGLLHLLGYDDHTKKTYTAMHKREDELLVAAGHPAVFGK